MLEFIMMSRRFAGIAALSITLALAACASSVKAPVLPAVTLDFLVDGRTTQVQSAERLGPATRQFAAADGGVVLTYRLGEDDGGLHPVPAPGAWFDFARRRSLVMHFDAQGVLRRHAVVAARGG
jgi:hypothetical protein